MALKLDADVDRWMRETNPPLEPTMRLIAEIALGADPRMSAYLKHGTVSPSKAISPRSCN